MHADASGGFDELQRRLIQRFGDRGASEVDSGTIVVLPSISFPTVELRKITAITRYEERLLFILLLLARPDLRVVFVTSMPIDPAIVDYYLAFTPNPDDARHRLVLIDLDDPEPNALVQKVLDRSDVLERIRAAAGAPESTYLLPFNVTDHERVLSESLGIALYGPRPDLIPLGSKSGSRRLARATGVPVLDGSEDIYSIEELEEALQALHRRRPGMAAAVVKLNNGFSGQGNAIVRLDGFHIPLDGSDTVFCAPRESWSSFRNKIESDGCIIEELMRRPGVTSPSVQLRVWPDGTPEVLSTHDQILGDPDGQVYLGCRFPARREYRSRISEIGLQIGEALAKEGVIGSFGIDLVVVPDGDEFAFYLSEINLRMGGTTHPFLMARYVSGGSYEFESGDLVVDGGRTCYVATDNLKSQVYASLTPEQVIEEVRERGLAYNRPEHRGITLHLLGALPDHGKLGAVCIARTMPQAESLYSELIALLDDLAWGQQG